MWESVQQIAPDVFVVCVPHQGGFVRPLPVANSTHAAFQSQEWAPPTYGSQPIWCRRGAGSSTTLRGGDQRAGRGTIGDGRWARGGKNRVQRTAAAGFRECDKMAGSV